MRLFFVASAVLALTGNAYAIDQCRDILEKGISDESTRVSSQKSAETDRSYYCSATLQEARSYYSRQDKSSRSGRASGTVSYGPFRAGGGSKQSDVKSSVLTEADYEQWKGNSCSEQERRRSHQAFEFEAQSSVDPATVGAWRDCMLERDGLTCFAEPQDDDIMFNIAWRTLKSSRATVSNTYLRGGTSLWDGAQTGRVLAADWELPRGHITVPISRANKGPVSINLNIIHDGQALSCSIFVPAILQPDVEVGNEKEPQRRSSTGQFACDSNDRACWRKFEEVLTQIAPKRPKGWDILVRPAIVPLPGRVFDSEPQVERFNFIVKEPQ